LNRWIGLLLSAAILTGCNSVNDMEKDKASVEAPALIEVTIKTTPEKALPGDEVLIEASVTQSGEPVDNANEVSFEVWNSDDKEHEMINAEHNGEGIYSIRKEFEKDGVYSIVAHVTAREQHTMPKMEYVVGEPASVQDEIDANSETSSNHEHSHSDSQVDHHGEGNIVIELKIPDEIRANNSVALEVFILHKEEPLTDAKVKFELWSENATKHDFIQTTETDAGTYTAQYEFNQTGKNFITVHVQNSELHEHIERELDIK
jgi:hypothetical protein